MEKCNGLHSGTVICEAYDNKTKLEAHWNNDLKEVVIVRSWWVASGKDDVDQEFEIETSFENIQAWFDYQSKIFA